MQSKQRFPELLGWGEPVIVSAAQLPTFEAKILGAHKPLQLIPPGVRPFYCLNRVGETFAPAPPPGFDFCGGALAAPAAVAEDTGRTNYTAVNLGSGNILGLQAPFYRGGKLPSTVKARRAAFVGWVGMALNSQLVLANALRGYPGVAVAFRYNETSPSIVFRSGSAPHGAQSALIDLHNG